MLEQVLGEMLQVQGEIVQLEMQRWLNVLTVKKLGYGGSGTKNAGRQSRNQAFNARNGNDDSNQIIQRVSRTESTPGKAKFQCYNCNEKGHYTCGCQKRRVRDAKYFREQMLLAMKDKDESNLNNEENDFMIDTSYGDETMEELTSAVMLMARIQPANCNAETVPSYDAKAASEVNASSKVHEQMRHKKHKTIIQTSDDDQIDSNIIFDDPYVENNGGATIANTVIIVGLAPEYQLSPEAITSLSAILEKGKILANFPVSGQPGIIMANLPNNNEFALVAEAAPDNMNGWVEEEDPEMKEEEEDPKEDPEIKEEEEEMDADEQ
ncbi:retrovirus-related pol polyprotein from transposon TNT 1-94 [Tanacetum coccineum]